MYLNSFLAGPLKGEIFVPGDKSISHRAVIFGSIAKGITIIHGFLEAQDCFATLNAFRAMGVQIQFEPKDKNQTLQNETNSSDNLFFPSSGNKLIINGVGKKGLIKPLHPIDCQNSGTTMRLLAGLLAGQPFDTVLWGDSSLSRRPMSRICVPLGQMGASIETSEGNAPLKIYKTKTFKGIKYVLPMASAQVKSCLLLAGLYAEGCTEVIEPETTRDHTERMLASFCYPIEKKKSANQGILINSNNEGIGTEIFIPGDFSSAAFFIVAATLIPGSEVVINNLGINPTRIGLLNTLIRMGASIEIENSRTWGNEQVANLKIKHAQLRGILVSKSLIPLMIDELPILCIAAAFAEGETTIRGAKELRFKESDRIHAMAEGLKALGIKIKTLDDGLIIKGNDGKTLQGGRVDSFGDHRIAMSFAIAGALSQQPITISSSQCLKISFPNFINLANQINMNIQELHEV